MLYATGAFRAQLSSAMIIQNAISKETAENAWKSLERQVMNRHAAESQLSPATKLNDKPFMILYDTEEVSAACEEFAKVYL